MNSKSKYIRTVGDIYIDSSLIDGPGVRVTNDFLTSLVSEFSKQAAKYMYFLKEAPFTYRERQLHSIIAPALSKYTDVFLMEAPTDRNWTALSKKDYADSYGWIDYWCYYRETVFLMEIKHGFISLKKKHIREKVKRDWHSAIQQLNVVEKYAKTESEWAKRSFRVLFFVLVFYETANNVEPKTLHDVEALLSIKDKCNAELKPDWSAFWKLHKNLSGPYEYATTEYYPGVLFMTKVL